MLFLDSIRPADWLLAIHPSLRYGGQVGYLLPHHNKFSRLNQGTSLQPDQIDPRRQIRSIKPLCIFSGNLFFIHKRPDLLHMNIIYT